MTASNFAILAQRNQMKLLQDPGLSVPGNVLEVRFRFGSTPPNFSDLAGGGLVRTELREH